MIILQVRKSIGKMGRVVKSGANKAVGAAVAAAPEVKHQLGQAKYKAERLADRGLNYAERVRDNATESSLVAGVESNARHEHAEQFLIGNSYERAEHHGKRKHKAINKRQQTIVIHVNSKGRKKRKRKTLKSGFSLI